MKQVLFIGVIIVALASLNANAGGKDFPDKLTFTAMDGKTVDSVALKSAPLVLVVGAAWCPECRQEAPEVQKAYAEYKDKGVQFLFVFGGSKDGDIKEFLETYKVTYPAAKDNGLADTLGVRVIPQTFFYAKGGVLSKRIMGAVTYKELMTNIETILRSGK